MLLIGSGLLLAALLAAALYAYAPDKPRLALEARYAAPPSTFVQVAGIRLHIRDTGPPTAPAILMLHGFGASLHTWEAWAQALAPTHRVLRLDLPGFGLTGPDPTHDYSDTRTLQVLAALLDHQSIPRATIVGNSMGGRLAWKFAASHPARTDKLVLISPDGFASPGLAYNRRVELPMLMRLLPHTLPPILLERTLAASYADPTRLRPETVTRYADLLRTPGVRQAILDRIVQSVLVDPVPILRTIAAPTLLLWGEQDRMIPVTHAPDYQAILPHATTATLPTLGHVPQEEDPALSLLPLLAFLQR